MHARRWWELAALTVMVAATATNAAADPKPKTVDIKAFRDKLVVLQDADGGTYVVLPADEPRVWYGLPKKPLYENIVSGHGADGEAGTWDINVWAPRVPKFQPGSIMKKSATTYIRWCGDNSQLPLTLAPADKAKTILDKGSFMSTAFIREPYLLARDDNGVYYYVDVIRDEYGGNGYRVFVGKKGALKLRPLTDIAKDSAGDVFATKTGDLRLVRDADENKSKITWVKGGKHNDLVALDVDANSNLIFKELGIYSFTGSICENM